MFINYKTVDVELLNNLSSHILTSDVYEKFIQKNSETVLEKCVEPIIMNDIEINITKFDNLVSNVQKINMLEFIPKHDDTLFWCIFILHFGKVEYELINTKYKNFEINEKMKMVEYLKSNKNVLKKRKISKVETQEIMGKMMSSNITDLQCLHGLCAYYNIHVIIANRHNKTYISYDYSENDNKIYNKIIVVHRSTALLSTTKCKYFIYSNDEVSNIIDNYVKFESFNKPFNGISMYKLVDLEIIRKKLGLEENKNKKSEIYKQINVAVA